ncbi:MAG: hypothetical protein IJY08_03920 [Clostridia bacterium]|nr:hypothetical protein [Clostridia bacterium]
MNFSDVTFKRLFSMTMFKNKKIPLGAMTFTKDFVTDTRGDLYPITDKSRELSETVENNLYSVTRGNVTRFVCRFFPFASYNITANATGGEFGFVFRLPLTSAKITVKHGSLCFTCDDTTQKISLPKTAGETTDITVSCRPGAFDVYLKVNRKPQLIHSFSAPSFGNSNSYEVFSDGEFALYAAEGAVIREVSSFIDNGLSTADMRPLRYENGDIIVEGGRIYLSVTLRIEVEMFQGILSWVPGTSDFELTGALFYDSGDGKWCGDVAASILYNRECKKWYLWVCSFNHDHVLGHSEFEGDPRFGVNVIDIKLMDKATPDNDITDFIGFEGDEDPDFFYHPDIKKWFMAICRKNPITRKYGYMFFSSNDPFSGYKYIGKGYEGAETGGSFVRIDGKRYFICGNDFNVTSDYRIYSDDGMQNARFDYPDGGFRGWGTLMPIKLGSRTRYFWLTFDRHNASDYNWSYGNIYCFEADKFGTDK